MMSEWPHTKFAPHADARLEMNTITKQMNHIIAPFEDTDFTEKKEDGGALSKSHLQTGTL